MSSTNQRVKDLRNHLKLNQAEFGQNIGLKNGAISWMEKEGNTVTEQNIKAICDAFNVNMDWLRNGNGEMFAPKKIMGAMEMLQQEMELTANEVDAIRAFLAMPHERRQMGLQFIEDFAKELENLPPLEPQAPPVDQPQQNPDGTYTVTVEAEDWKALEELKRQERLAQSVSTSTAANEKIS